MPDTRFRMIWNFVVLALLLYTATVTPYRTAFMEVDSGSALANIEIFVDAMYGLDLILNFFMAFED